MKANTYTIKNYKTLNSSWLTGKNGFKATLYRNGTKLGVVEVAPNSGAVNFDVASNSGMEWLKVNFDWEPVIWRNGLLETLFIDACKALDVKPECHGSFIKQGEYDEGIVLDYLHNLIDESKG